MSFLSSFFNKNNETTEALANATEANRELRQSVEQLSAEVQELRQRADAPAPVIELAASPSGVSVVAIRFTTKLQTVSPEIWSAEYAGQPVKKLLTMFSGCNTDDINNVTLQFADQSTTQLKVTDELPETTPVQVVISQTSGSGAA